METQGESTDIQARVLQNTLAEVASLKRNRSDDTDNNQGVEDNTSAATERCCIRLGYGLRSDTLKNPYMDPD